MSRQVWHFKPNQEINGWKDLSLFVHSSTAEYTLPTATDRGNALQRVTQVACLTRGERPVHALATAPVQLAHDSDAAMVPGRHALFRSASGIRGVGKGNGRGNLDEELVGRRGWRPETSRQGRFSHAFPANGQGRPTKIATRGRVGATPTWSVSRLCSLARH